MFCCRIVCESLYLRGARTVRHCLIEGMRWKHNRKAVPFAPPPQRKLPQLALQTRVLPREPQERRPC